MKLINLIASIILSLSCSAFAIQKDISLNKIESFTSKGAEPKTYLVLRSTDGDAYFIDSSEDLLVEMALSASLGDSLSIQYDESALVKFSENQYAVRNVVRSVLVQKVP